MIPQEKIGIRFTIPMNRIDEFLDEYILVCRCVGAAAAAAEEARCLDDSYVGDKVTNKWI